MFSINQCVSNAYSCPCPVKTTVNVNNAVGVAPLFVTLSYNSKDYTE